MNARFINFAGEGQAGEWVDWFCPDCGCLACDCEDNPDPTCLCCEGPIDEKGFCESCQDSGLVETEELPDRDGWHRRAA